MDSGIGGRLRRWRKRAIGGRDLDEGRADDGVVGSLWWMRFYDSRCGDVVV